MKVVCDQNMPLVREAFETLGDVCILNGRDITADDVRDAELLAIRSTTKVNAALLDGSAVKFVGTATIGTDHIDQDYCAANGIHWCFSPGCNANSVSQYVTAALLVLADRYGIALEGQTIGVVGVGNVGSKVVRKAEALGMRVLQNDPPRERVEGAAHFVSLESALAESDVVTMHVPLTRDGDDPTWQMANGDFFSRMKPGAAFINAARGDIVNSDALLAAMQNGTPSHVVMDTWQGEPAYRQDVLSAVDIATPHIAGHSFEGKVMGTVMVYRNACRFLGVPPEWDHEPLMPDPPAPRVTVDAAGRTRDDVLHEIVRQTYDILADDARLRESMSDDPIERAQRFDAQRKQYPMRREFDCTTVMAVDRTRALSSALDGLGFRMG